MVLHVLFLTVLVSRLKVSSASKVLGFLLIGMGLFMEMSIELMTSFVQRVKNVADDFPGEIELCRLTRYVFSSGKDSAVICIEIRLMEWVSHGDTF